MRPLRIWRVLILMVVLIGAAAFVLPGRDVRADLIILKDGFVLRGKVQVEGKYQVERTEDGPVVDFIRTGFYYIEDGVRRVIFSPKYLSHIEERKIDTSSDVRWQQYIRYMQGKPTPPILQIEKETPWDEKWDRTVDYRSVIRENNEQKPFSVRIPLHLQILTPEFAMADSKRIHYKWQPHYLTRELGPELVRELLSHHKDLRDDASLDEETRITRRFKVYHFLAQAEWLDEAAKDLGDIEKHFPKAKERVAEARKNLEARKAVQLYDDIKRAHDAGQYQWVKEHLAKLPDSGLPEKMHVELRALKDEYESAEANLKLARATLSTLATAFSSGDLETKKVLTDAVRSIADELCLDHFLKSKAELRGGDKEGQRVGRLDLFLAQAQQYERDKKQNAKSDVRPEQLASLAVTGWLLGGRSAETKPEFARQLWLARKMVINHQKTVGAEARRRLLEAYQQEQSQRNPAISVEEFAQMIPTLPPPEPPAKLSASEMEFTAAAERGNRPVEYVVKLPPEYHPARPWPVLIVLHQTSETPADSLRRWTEQAARNGYIVAAPRWATPGGAYEYSSAEHNIVLDLLRDLRRKFQVDSDRVSLTGTASGGSMAFDVGMSHPDQFAGVLPICGLQSVWGDRYLRNAQYLPYYVVCGDMCFNIHKENRRLLKDWITKQFPMMYVEYKGRGMEPYAAEATFAFDWMNRKTRANPASEVGATGREFRTLRHEDNRFYWLSTNKISDKCVMPDKWKPNTLEATMSAQVIAGNKIDVKTSGLKQVAVWFGRGLKVNINAPVTIIVNNAVKWTKAVKPDLATLLDDLYERGDRQRLYLARVDMEL